MLDSLLALGNGLAIAVQPHNLLFALVGVLLGTAVGVLPGIGPALTVALLLPITYKLDPGGSLIMFAGIYYGGMYGGSTTAILFAATAAAFGRRAVLADLAIGLVIAVAIYLLFSKLLSLSLPVGPIERLI